MTSIPAEFYGDPNNPDNGGDGFVERVSVMSLPFLAHNSEVSQSNTFASQ
jgi:hypothetical protein